MIKFGLNYRLTAQGNFQGVPYELEIQYPLRIDFDIIRHNYASTNTAQIRLYNLSAQHRNMLLHDQYDFSPEDVLSVTLQAGYGNGPQWPVIFSGNATRAYSVREGVNFVTVIEAQDGGDAYANATVNTQFPAGTQQRDIIIALIEQLKPYGVSAGSISKFEGEISKGVAYSGNVLDILRQLTNQNFFIDNLTANALVPGDSTAANVLTIDASAGLLETPIKQQQYLEIKILFEPRLVIGSQINLKSSTAAVYNGVHQVVSLHHKGTISGATSGHCVTILGAQAGVFNAVTAQVGA